MHGWIDGHTSDISHVYAFLLHHNSFTLLSPTQTVCLDHFATSVLSPSLPSQFLSPRLYLSLPVSLSLSYFMSPPLPPPLLSVFLLGVGQIKSINLALLIILEPEYPGRNTGCRHILTLGTHTRARCTYTDTHTHRQMQMCTQSQAHTHTYTRTHSEVYYGVCRP